MKHCDWCNIGIDLNCDEAHLLPNDEEDTVCDACYNDYLVQNPSARACDYCGVLTFKSELVEQRDSSQYCQPCHKEQSLMEMIQSVMYAALRVNFDSKFTVIVNYQGSCNVLAVTLAASKEDYNNYIAHAWISLDSQYSDPMKQLETVRNTLTEIAITNHLPTLKPYENEVYPYELAISGVSA